MVEATRALQGQLDALKADKVTDLKSMSERITKLEAGARHIFLGISDVEREVRESVLKEELHESEVRERVLKEELAYVDGAVMAQLQTELNRARAKETRQVADQSTLLTAHCTLLTAHCSLLTRWKT